MIILNTVGDTIQAVGSAATSLTVSLYGTETVAGVDTYKRLGQMQLTGGSDTLYTVPALTSSLVSVMVIANTSGVDRTISVYNVPNAGSLGDSTAIMKATPILANQSMVWNRGDVSVIPFTGAAGIDGASGFSGYSGLGISGFSGFTGAIGPAGGAAIPYLFDSTTSAPPVAGDIRMDNAAFASVTTIWINILDSNAVDVDVFLDTIKVDDYVKIQRQSPQQANFGWFKVVSNTQNAGYHTLVVTYVSSNGSVANNNPLDFFIASIGQSGYSGYSGTNGLSGYSGYSGSGVSGYSGYSGSGISGYSGFSGVASATRATFVNADLAAGVLTITHNKGLSAPYTILTQIFDNTNKTVIPDEVTGATNTTLVDLTSFGTLTGTWGYIYLT